MIDKRVGRIVYTKEQILNKTKELAQEIARDYYPLYLQDKEGFKLVLLGILKGCEPFMSDLYQELNTAFTELLGEPSPALSREYVCIRSTDEKGRIEELE